VTVRPAALVVRPVARADAGAWLALREALWPGTPNDHRHDVDRWFTSPPPREACFVAERPGVGIVGFAELRLREYAEDCTTSPVGFLEGIFVSPEQRFGGVGRALVAAGEAWARERGCTEMASDRELSNDASGAFHESLGYVETVRIVCYRRDLDHDRAARSGGAASAGAEVP
jgi:aminoglycoside 6'-N-acetyltransferase I